MPSGCCWPGQRRRVLNCNTQCTRRSCRPFLLPRIPKAVTTSPKMVVVCSRGVQPLQKCSKIVQTPPPCIIYVVSLMSASLLHNTYREGESGGESPGLPRRWTLHLFVFTKGQGRGQSSERLGSMQAIAPSAHSRRIYIAIAFDH